VTVLDEFPQSGRVVVAHPDSQPAAGIFADNEGIDLFLSELAPPKDLYMLDLDAVTDFDLGSYLGSYNSFVEGV